MGCDVLELRIASMEEINNSRDRWNHLVKSMKFPTVFLTWEWITAWINHFGKDYRLIILFIYDRDELVAILPLAEKTMRLEDGFLKVKTITICGSIELSPDHLDIICEKANNVDGYIKEIMNFLRSNYSTWDILYLAFLAEQGELASWFKIANTEYRVRSNTILAPYITNESSFNTFFQKLKSKKRYNINREKNILFEKKVHLKTIMTQGDLEKALENLFRLHQVRAHQKGIDSTFRGNKIINFHRQISRTFLENGWLRFYLLRSDDNVTAAGYGFVFDRRFSFYQTGMDPDWKKFSPGKILILEILKDIFKDGIVEFDFLGGNDSYKTFWTKNTRSILTLRIYNRNITSSIEYWANTLRHSCKAILKRTPYFEGLKRLIRRKYVYTY